MGGVMLSCDRDESTDAAASLKAAAAAASPACCIKCGKLDCSNASNNDDDAFVPGLSRSMPCRLKKCTLNDFIVPALKLFDLEQIFHFKFFYHFILPIIA